MKFKNMLNSKRVYIILCVIVVLEIIAAIVSIAIAPGATQRDDALSNLFLGIFALIMFSLPFLIESRYKIEVPNYLKIVVLVFLFIALVLGNIHGFVESVKGYDKFLHVFSGILISIIGFEIVHYMSQSKGNVKHLSPGLISIFAFSFSITLLVLWEFYEFFVDTLAYQLNNDTERNMQRYQWLYEGVIFPQDYGLIDTMLDLLVGFLGAAFVSFLGWRILIKQQIDKQKNLQD